MSKVQLLIEYDTNGGQINVQGPLDNKILALGMLRFAEKIVLDHKQAPSIVAAPASALRGVNGTPGQG